jgi:hypothetical protein
MRCQVFQPLVFLQNFLFVMHLLLVLPDSHCLYSVVDRLLDDILLYCVHSTLYSLFVELVLPHFICDWLVVGILLCCVLSTPYSLLVELILLPLILPDFDHL